MRSSSSRRRTTMLLRGGTVGGADIGELSMFASTTLSHQTSRLTCVDTERPRNPPAYLFTDASTLLVSASPGYPIFSSLFVFLRTYFCVALVAIRPPFVSYPSCWPFRSIWRCFGAAGDGGACT
jgi:hypothetical protein